MRVKPVVVALFVCVTLAACGKDQAASGSAAAAPVVTVHAKDFAFVAPAEITAGPTTFHLVNEGTVFHHMQIVRLDSGKTTDDLVAAMKNPGPPPAWAAFVSGPNAPNPGGGESNATVTLTPGNYALICMVDVPDGVMHVLKGMATTLVVKPAAAGAAVAAAPAGDVTITLQDYQFAFSTPITAGHHSLLVKTQPGQPHEIELIRLNTGKTADDLMKWLNKMDGPPPGSAMGGVAATSNGVDVSFAADFTPGDYVVICFLPDAKDGKPHFMKGMMQPFKVS